MIYRYAGIALLVVAVITVMVFVVENPIKDNTLAVVPTDPLLFKYIKDTGYHPEVAFKYLIEKHGAPILMKGFKRAAIDPNDSKEEQERKLQEAEREMNERDAKLEDLSKEQLARKYLKWVESKDTATLQKILEGFLLLDRRPYI